MNDKRHEFKQEKTIAELIFEYEAMSHKNMAGFFEETEFIQLLNYYERKNLGDKAQDVISLALSQHPFSAELFVRQAQIYIENDLAHDALHCLDKADLYAPNDPEIALVRAEAFILLALYDEALSLLDRLKLSSHKFLDEIFVCEAMVHEDRGEHDKMFRSLRSALKVNHKNQIALKRIWYSVDLSGQYQESIKLHLHIIDEDPYSYVAWYNLGYAYASMGKQEKAADAFEYAFIINNKFEYAYRDCADAFIACEKFQKAIDVYKDASEHFSPDGEILMKLGKCNEALGHLARAKAFYFQAIDHEPENAELHFQLGACYARESCWLSAIGSFTRAVDLDGRNEVYVASLAEAFYQNDDEINAKLYFQKTTETAPEESKYWIQYASFLMDIGEEIEALEVLDEANLYATGIELLYCRIVCLLQKGNRKQALYLLGEALHEDFDMHDAIFHLCPELQEDNEVVAVINAYTKT